MTVVSYVGLGAINRPQDLVARAQDLARRALTAPPPVLFPGGSVAAMVLPYVSGIPPAASAVASQVVGNLVRTHETTKLKQIAAGAQSLLRAGVSRSEVDRRVRAAVQQIPAVQARKAVAERRATGRVSKPTQDALRKAQAAHPELKRQIDKVAAPAGREVQRQINRAAAPARREVKRQIQKATAPVRGAVNDLVKGIPPALRGPAKALADSVLKGKLDQKAVQQLGAKEAKKVLNQYAAKYGKQALDKLTPPGVKLPGGIDVGGAVNMLVSGKVTAEGVKELVYDSTKGTAESFIKGATGFPITLPKDLSAKAILGSVTSLIPTDINSAINTGVAIATQAVSGAVTAALAGSAIGSVIPGLGTVVGIGVALGVNALRGALKGKPPPYARKCKTLVPCPKVPNLSALELLPWIAKHQVPVWEALAKSKTVCGYGGTSECATRLFDLTDRVLEILNPPGVHANILTKGTKPDPKKATAYMLGLPQLAKMIPKYEQAPKSRLGKDRDGKVVKVPNAALALVLAQMKWRKEFLDAFVKESKTVPKMLAGPVEGFRYKIWAELGKAAEQAAMDPSKETRDWVVTLSEMLKKNLAREAELKALSQKSIADAHARRAQLAKDPNWKPKQYIVE
jgi:F0F1-type ATP synthase membrane subunit b/b'